MKKLVRNILIFFLPLILGLSIDGEARRYRPYYPPTQPSVFDLTSCVRLKFRAINPSGREEQIRIVGHYEPGFLPWLRGRAYDEQNYTATFYLIPTGSYNAIELRTIDANPNGSFSYDIPKRYHVRSGDQIRVDFRTQSGRVFASGTYAVYLSRY